MTTILWTIFIGFIIGLVAKFLMPGRDPGGFIITVLIGIAGSFVATYLGMAMGWYRNGETAGFIAGVLGALVLLIAYRLVAARK
jgi:uncharacterized membrane protein YeaQ/YmgE (transglycosylase-associated protein family)